MDGTYDAEQEMKGRGALYEKTLMLFASNVVLDGRLVTGQKPRSAKATVKQVAALKAAPGFVPEAIRLLPDNAP